MPKLGANDACSKEDISCNQPSLFEKTQGQGHAGSGAVKLHPDAA